jgi:hypothetical protein
VAAGVNVTLIVHEAWAGSDVPQVVAEMANALALVPVMVSPERVIAVLSLFVSVTVFAALVLLGTCLSKARVVTEVVAWATPVPVRLTVCGQMLALSAIESVAVMAPVAAGVNVTLIVHEAWAASDVPQVFAEMANALALVPVMVSPERVMAVLSLFVSVAFFAALVLLTPCLPKDRVAGVNVACAKADEPRTSRESRRRTPLTNTLVPYFASLEPVGENKRTKEIEARIGMSFEIRIGEGEPIAGRLAVSLRAESSAKQGIWESKMARG